MDDVSVPCGVCRGMVRFSDQRCRYCNAPVTDRDRAALDDRLMARVPEEAQRRARLSSARWTLFAIGTAHLAWVALYSVWRSLGAGFADEPASPLTTWPQLAQAGLGAAAIAIAVPGWPRQGWAPALGLVVICTQIFRSVIANEGSVYVGGATVHVVAAIIMILALRDARVIAGRHAPRAALPLARLHRG